MSIVDGFTRKFEYLRLSVTDRCNFRCNYCLPKGFENKHEESELSLDEIKRLVRAFSILGVKKVRLTGGEPTVRRDILEIAGAISKISGIKKTALTTNGYRLKELAEPLLRAGVRSLNVSLDSLDPDKFHDTTGTRRFEEVMAGIDRALALPFDSIKLNAVLLRDINSGDIDQFLSWIKNRKVSIRFIELMRTGQNQDFFERRHVSAGELRFKFLKEGWKFVTRQSTDGPAIEMVHPDYIGSVGIIAPYSEDFCKSCNRLRVTSRGALRLCLFGDEDYSLRKYLQSDSDEFALMSQIQKLVFEKPVSHFLQEGRYGNTANLSGVGG